MMAFTELFKPIKLGTLEIKNRIGGACTTTGGADINGYITENALATYAARAAGGAGVVCIECTFASNFGAETTSFGNPRISDRSYWPGLSDLAETIQSFGAKAMIQITPSFGRQGSSSLSGKMPPAPSPIPYERPKDFDMRLMPYGYEARASQDRKNKPPREVTREEIEYMEKQYPDAVTAARICGFDAVEVHSPHGYMIWEFLSLRSNRRTDEYGGNLENRMRFLKNIIMNTRKRIGPDFPFGIRLSGDEHMPDGMDEEEVLIVAQEMEALGIDWVHVSDGSYEARHKLFPQDALCMVNHGAAFKKVLKVPVLVPSVHDPYLAEEIIKEGKADMVTLGRQLISDPQWPHKVKEGRIDDIRTCIRCNVCLARFNRGHRIRCVQNPEVGREKYYPKYQRPEVRPNEPPCEVACPAHLDIQNYILMAARGYFPEALRRIRKTTPLYGVLGRVCHRPCETVCNREDMDEPIAINAIKRFVADYEISKGCRDVIPAPRSKEETIAVVGSGPAGLSAAYDLVNKGYGVTIFEALPVAGGMMAVGIPDYRLPKDILNAEIDVIKKTGVEIRLNNPVGQDGLTFDDLWEQKYKAIFISSGAHLGTKLGIPNEELEGVVDGVSWLRDIHLGRDVKVGEKVVVVGGGNVAIDSARMALRLGAKAVTIAYRRSSDEMPAIKDEITEAEEEGIKIHLLSNPCKILSESGKCTGMECFQMELGEHDGSGRREPLYVEGSEFIVEADMIIIDVGQVPDLSLLPWNSKLQISRRGTVVTEVRGMATNIPGIFAGGDAVSGPSSVIEAIAAGKRAASGMDCYLRGVPFPSEYIKPPVVTMDDAHMKWHLREVEKEDRTVMPTLDPKERKDCTKEVGLGFGEEETVREARRCLNCRNSGMKY
jgi:NADPH-dependent glutamate synthase beta subunit-like oxidoreductase/2,4-dienoyl-CoA reductase-like NADH-dependent reductase (Old Yellow Enzyme family)